MIHLMKNTVVIVILLRVAFFHYLIIIFIVSVYCIFVTSQFIYWCVLFLPSDLIQFIALCVFNWLTTNSHFCKLSPQNTCMYNHVLHSCFEFSILELRRKICVSVCFCFSVSTTIHALRRTSIFALLILPWVSFTQRAEFLLFM